MNIARLLFPIHVLGPGERIGIWMAGCGRGCPGCSNPELWEQRPEWETDADSVLRLVRMISDDHPIDGFTITGGDPLDQPDALRELLPRLAEIAPDILVYTGYIYEELDSAQKGALSAAAVLIDGPYREELNRGQTLRGSENQRIIYFKDEYQPLYESYQLLFRGAVENFPVHGGVISVGIHRADCRQKLKAITEKKGLEEIEHGR